MQRSLLLTIGGKNIYNYNNVTFAFESGLSVDADGSPHAYHPLPESGLDYLANAGSPGDWWALVTDNNGNPLIQGPNAPAPGYYISTTALEDTTKGDSDPAKYVNSETIPFVSLPSLMVQYLKKGSIGYAYNKLNKLHSYFIFADTGSNKHIGEGSIKLAENLGINDSPKKGGIADNIVYLLFAGSGDGKVKTTNEIENIGNTFYQQVNADAIVADF